MCGLGLRKPVLPTQNTPLHIMSVYLLFSMRYTKSVGNSAYMVKFALKYIKKKS